MTIEELIKGCIDKNPVAQKELYETFKGKMMGVCLRYAEDRDEAHDILQNGFIKVFENLAMFKNAGSFEGWVRRIMVNTALENFRKNKAQKQNVDIANVGYFLKSDNDTGSTINANDLLKMIQQLPVGFRTVFNLFAIEGYSHKEIADMLEITEGTSKSQYSRARTHLQEMILSERKNALT